MNYLRDIKELEGVKVLVRLDLNVPVQGGAVTDDFRIRKILPTISFLKEKKAKIILMSHIEASGGHKSEKPSLAPIAKHLQKLGVDCIFVKNYKTVEAELERLSHDQVILLENLRFFEGEESNDPKFGKELASLADIYVNEAFAVSHRTHASVGIITTFLQSYAGFLFEQEIENLSKAFNPEHPFFFIIGGAKFETKLPLIEKFIGIADKVFVGGALANNFLKAQGKDVGKSLVSSGDFDLDPILNNPKLLLPVDHVAVDTAIYDIGEKTVKMIEKEIKKAKYILWNGPLGLYEQGFIKPTLTIAKTIAEATGAGAKSLIGGGDTLGAIDELNLEDQFTFVSTGGAAMLEFLSKGTLPGIETLEKAEKQNL